VASLAEIGRLAVQEKGMGRSMRGVAREAVLHGGGMFPQEWPPYMGVALETLQVLGLRLHKPIRNGPVGIVAIPARDFPLPYGMVSLPEQLCPDPFVAPGTRLYLRGF